MSEIPTKNIDGDISVSRNVSTGGDVDVQGNARVGHNLVVEGWLEARNIKGPNKGMFVSVTALKGVYPHPQPGWWALCGLSLPAPLYVAQATTSGIEWVDTGTTAGNPTVSCEVYNQAVATLDQRTQDNAKKISDIHAEIVTVCASVNRMAEEHNTMREMVLGFDGRLTAMAPRTFSLDQLDTLGTDGKMLSMYALLKDTPHTRFRVVATYQSDTFTVGFIDVFMDSLRHVITEVLTTHYTISSGGVLQETHVCKSIMQYFRTYNIDSPELTIPKNTWTGWRELTADLKRQIDGINDLLPGFADGEETEHRFEQAEQRMSDIEQSAINMRGDINTNTAGLGQEITNRQNADTALLNAINAEAASRTAGDQGVESRVNARIDSIENNLSGNTSNLHALSSLELGRLEIRPFDAVLKANIDPYTMTADLIERGDLSEGDIVWSEKYSGFLAFNGETFSAYWGDVIETAANEGGGKQIGGMEPGIDITETVKFTDSEYYGTVYPGTSGNCRRPNRKSLFHNRADNSIWLWDGSALRKVADITALQALAARLETLIGHGDVSGVIDTFNEIEAFLTGITNTETLTGLLQELRTEVLNAVSAGYQPKETGKGLSSNDFTNALKNKLSQLPTASELPTALDNKVDVEEGKGLSSNDFTAEHKEKLEALPCAEDIEFQFNELNEHVGQHDTQISDLSDSVEDLYVAFDFISAQFNALNSRFTDYLKKWEGTIDEFCDDFSEIDNNTLYFIYIPENILFTVFYGRQQVWVDQSINTISGFISPDGYDDWYGFPYTYLNRVSFEFVSFKSDSNLQFNSRLEHPIYCIGTDDDYTHRSLKSCSYPPAMYINVSFSMCDLLESIDLSKIRRFYFPNLFECFFEGCTSLKSAYLDGMDTLNLTSLYKSFYNCHSLKSLYIKGWDFSNVTNFDYAFVYCISLTNIYGPVHGIKAEIDISYSDLLTRQSALVLINGLEEVSTSQTIYFHESAFERLTNADIAIANAKGWNVVGC